ncbi:hypothetical protein ECHOSC_0096 [Ehrlichia chaffeensis str. Osceola]|nr:hypothetical protein ECHOSC_0096 [Ehrlichia chaffeensis str. Osceola]AHX08814.1 hypothetical protein ECHSTV_0093 [Ehrlichia chaffeensis str. Saint Vincent]AHX09142.1 hypothetical protein ECHWAK_0091 [Ehrlichia chaffeensis str. Wakulla]
MKLSEKFYSTTLNDKHYITNYNSAKNNQTILSHKSAR